MNENIENIIFDLGGVILNIDYNLTAQAFKDLGLTNFDEMYSQAAQTGLFDKFERGLCSSAYFINGLLDFMPIGTTPNQVVAAWNAMILELPTENLELLQALNAKYRIFLLSNTNEIHIQHFHRLLSQNKLAASLDPYFEKVYFSSEIKLRKPDVETFEKVCNDNNLNKSRTLFIDDTLQHIEGARKAGLNALHFQNGAYKLPQIFEKFV